MRLAILAAASLGLAGCTTTQNIDQAISQNLPKICSGAASIHSAFVIIAATGEIPAKTVAKERAAWAALEVVCADPGSVNSATALVTAAEAYAAMTIALRETE